MKLDCHKCGMAIAIPPEVLSQPSPRVECPGCGARFRLRPKTGAPPPNRIVTASDLAHHTTPAAGPVPEAEGATVVSTGGTRRSRAEAEPAFGADDVLSGRYRIVGFLARGGMGEVYEAEDLELRQRVALKTVSTHLEEEAGAVDRFKREIALARLVTHPNVCRIFDLGQHGAGGDAVTFLTMELLQGETLAQRLRRQGRMSPEACLPLLEQMAAALDAAHRARVVHRDFKSENVFLVPEDGGGVRAVVTDFGVARGAGAADPLAARVTGAVIVGTPAYMAPEQVEGAPEISSAADLYALGVVLYEMVTGRLPFDGPNPLTTAVKRLQEPPPPPHVHAPDLPAPWGRAILRCLERRPADRFPSVLHLVDALRPATTVATATPRATVPLTQDPTLPMGTSPPTVAVAPTQVARPTPGPRPAAPSTPTLPATPTPPAAQAPPRRTPALLGGVLVAVLLLSLALAWWNHRHRDPGRVQLRRSVAVMGLENLNQRSEVDWISTAVSEMLGTELSSGQDLRGVPGQRVADALQQLDLDPVAQLTPGQAGQLHGLLGCDFLVLGSYVSLPGPEGQDSLRLDLRVQDAALGTEIATVSEEGSVADLFAMVRTLGQGLRQALGAGEGGVDDPFSGLPEDPEAARLYAEALDHLRNVEPEPAKDLLQRAAAREGDKALIHSALSTAWEGLGYGQRAAQAAERAFELSSDLSREDRLVVEGRYRETQRDWGAARGVYRDLWESFPDQLDYGLRLVATETAAGMAVQALDTLDELRRLPEPLSLDPRLDLAEADAAGALSQLERQLAAADRAAAGAETQGADLLLAQALLARTRSLRLLGQGEAAEAAAHRALRVYRNLDHPGGEAQAMTALANTRADRGHFEEAAEGFRGAAELCRGIGDLGGLAAGLNNLAVVRRKQGDLDGAEAMYREAEATYLEIQNPFGQANTANNRAVILVDRDRLQEAGEMFERSRDLWRQIGGQAGEAHSLNNSAEVLRLQGRLEDSRRLHGEALQRRRDAGLKLDQITSLANLGGLLVEAGELDDARDRLDEASALADEVGERSAKAQVLFHLGQLHLERGDPGAARDAHRQALDLRLELEETAQVGRSQVALARVALAEGMLEEAEDLAATARQGALQDDRPADEVRAAAALATALLGADRADEAEELLGDLAPVEDALEQPAVRLEAGLARARLRAALGDGPAALGPLETLADEAAGLGMVPLELRLRRAWAELAADAGRGAEAAQMMEDLRLRAAAAGLDG
ncbi:MAG: serine/threonine-protein kinase [Acidobacteriota bacterium]